MVLRDLWGIHIDFRTNVYCEKNQSKQWHLETQFAPEMIVADFAQLLSDTAPNVASGEDQESLPPCDDIDCGVPCISRTPLSRNASRNVNCVQENREPTGIGFQTVLGVVKKHSPVMINFECVKGLASSKEDSEQSDAEWVCSELRNNGYWAHYEILDAEDFGAEFPRVRCWWAGVQISGDKDQITHFFNKILQSFRLPSSRRVKLEDMITLDPEALKKECDRLGMSLLRDSGLRQGANKETPSWKVFHKGIFDAFKLPWPAPPTVKTISNIYNGNLLPREWEACVFLDNVFPPELTKQRDGSATAIMQFVDINMDMARMLQLYFVDFDAFELKPGVTPWKNHPPTLVGSGKVVMRFFNTKDSSWAVRVLEGFENMRLIGWSDSFFNTAEGTEEGYDEERCLQTHTFRTAGVFEACLLCIVAHPCQGYRSQGSLSLVQSFGRRGLWIPGLAFVCFGIRLSELGGPGPSFRNPAYLQTFPFRQGLSPNVPFSPSSN